MATVQSLADRLRSELGDTGRSFVETITLDGTSARIELRHAPLQGSTLTVTLDGDDVSDASTIEEHTGVLTLPALPDPGSVLTVAGLHYRYFTDSEIESYISTAFTEHSSTSTTTYGSRYTYTNLPAAEEYPIVLLAASNALFTLATDAAFDIDILAPDGVTIPRSQRYRQLTEMMMARKDQYKELCTMLGVGMYRIEVTSLRRVTQRTNRYAPLYKPQEVDDPSRPQRVRIPAATYGSQDVSKVENYDIFLYQGDSHAFTVDFPFDLTGYQLLAQIRAYPGSEMALARFDIAVVNLVAGTVELSLTSGVTKQLPEKAVWDLQLTTDSDPDYQHTYIKGTIVTERQVSQLQSDPYAPGWRG